MRQRLIFMIVVLAAWNVYAQDNTAIVQVYRGDDKRVTTIFDDLGGSVTPLDALQKLDVLPSSLRFDGSKQETSCEFTHSITRTATRVRRCSRRKRGATCSS